MFLCCLVSYVWCGVLLVLKCCFFFVASKLIPFCFRLAKFQDPTNHARRFPRRSSGHLLSPASRAASPLPLSVENIDEEIHNEKSPHFWDLQKKWRKQNILLCDVDLGGNLLKPASWWLRLVVTLANEVYDDDSIKVTVEIRPNNTKPNKSMSMCQTGRNLK